MDDKADFIAPSAELKSYEDGPSSYGEIDRAEERKLVRKLDIHIIPVVMLLYMLSFLDRVCTLSPTTRNHVVMLRLG